MKDRLLKFLKTAAIATPLWFVLTLLLVGLGSSTGLDEKIGWFSAFSVLSPICLSVIYAAWAKTKIPTPPVARRSRERAESLTRLFPISILPAAALDVKGELRRFYLLGKNTPFLRATWRGWLGSAAHGIRAGAAFCGRGCPIPRKASHDYHHKSFAT